MKIDRIFQMVKFGVQFLHISLDSKITLKSAFKLNAIKHDTNAS